MVIRVNLSLFSMLEKPALEGVAKVLGVPKTDANFEATVENADEAKKLAERLDKVKGVSWVNWEEVVTG